MTMAKAYFVGDIMRYVRKSCKMYVIIFKLLQKMLIYHMMKLIPICVIILMANM